MKKNRHQKAKAVSNVLFWMMVISSVGILGVTMYNSITQKAPGWIQFGMVAALLSTAVSTSDFSFLSKKRKLMISAILVVIALSVLSTGIALSIAA